MIQHSSSLKGSEWKHVINSDEAADDWYLRHHADYGSIQWVQQRIYSLVFVVYISIIAVNILGKVVGRDNFNTTLWALFGAFCLIQLLLVFLMGFMICFILRRVSVVDDVIGLRKEIKIIGYWYILLAVACLFLFVIWRIISILDNSIDEWTEVCVLIFYLLCRIFTVIAHWRSTKWVVVHFEKALMAPMWHNMNTLELRTIVHEQTLDMMKDPGTALSAEESCKRLEMKNILADETAFDLFMRRLLEEFCGECNVK